MFAHKKPLTDIIFCFTYSSEFILMTMEDLLRLLSKDAQAAKFLPIKQAALSAIGMTYSIG